jgi:hypothetical protein
MSVLLNQPEGTLAPLDSRFSKAHCSFAPSIFCRFSWHALPREFSLALRNPGTAIAIRIPMIATTIMISTRVKPFFLRFILIHLLRRVDVPSGSRAIWVPETWQSMTAGRERGKSGHRTLIFHRLELGQFLSGSLFLAFLYVGLLSYLPELCNRLHSFCYPPYSGGYSKRLYFNILLWRLFRLMPRRSALSCLL